MVRFIREFLRLEAAGGIVLLAAAVLAMAAANSPLSSTYDVLSRHDVSFWINDGLMALFFLAVGIELKAEMKEGALAGRSQALLPCVAALGGVMVPALIYTGFNHSTPAMRGWAVPTATDIAFSLGVLALLGSRVAPGLRIFLMAVAVIDDLVAVLIIALFYTGEVSPPMLIAAVLCALILLVMDRRGVMGMLPYLSVGSLLWVAMIPSGVHAALAGVVLGMLMPVGTGKVLGHRLQPWVNFAIMPLFAFANAGVKLAGLSLTQVTHPVTLGITLGLLLGKPIGIALASGLLAKLRLVTLPGRPSEFFGVCMIAGIGFTMSLFIGVLAFHDPAQQLTMRLGVLLGSLLSAVLGMALLLSVRK